MSASAPNMEQFVADITARVQHQLLTEAPPAISKLDVVAFLRQFTKWKFKTPVDPDDYRWASVQMKAAITTSVTSGQVNYRAPANFHMLIFGIKGHLALNAATTETLSITGIGNPNLRDRMLLKAMNTRLALQNTDRSGAGKFFENANIPLAAIMDEFGGQPLEFDPPHVVPNGENMQLDISLQDTTSAVIGGSTDVGVNLKALFVRARE